MSFFYNLLNNDSMKCINENKYFIGFTVILLNIGARFIIDELDDDARSMINDSMVRRFFVFCSFFMATRDIIISITLTIVFVIIVNEFLGHENIKGIKDNETEKPSNFNKKELEKTIDQLKQIHSHL
jgi:hypothetical protein